MSAVPRTARGSKTRAKLLEAAERVLESLGYHEASIVKITERAGIGLGTFYLHFAGKQEIFDEVVEDLNRRGPSRDDGGCQHAGFTHRRRTCRFPRVLPLHRRTPDLVPHHPAGRICVPRRPAPALLAHCRRLRRRPQSRAADWGGAAHGSRGRGLGADGHSRTHRHALGPLAGRRSENRQPAGNTRGSFRGNDGPDRTCTGA